MLLKPYTNKKNHGDYNTKELNFFSRCRKVFDPQNLAFALRQFDARCNLCFICAEPKPIKHIKQRVLSKTLTGHFELEVEKTKFFNQGPTLEALNGCVIMSSKVTIKHLWKAKWQLSLEVAKKCPKKIRLNGRRKAFRTNGQDFFFNNSFLKNTCSKPINKINGSILGLVAIVPNLAHARLFLSISELVQANDINNYFLAGTTFKLLKIHSIKSSLLTKSKNKTF